MVDSRSIKNRMEFVRQKARNGIGPKPGWGKIHQAAMSLDATPFPVPWIPHQFFPDHWAKASIGGLDVSVCPLWGPGFRWTIIGERKLVGDCDSMREAQDAVERVLAFLLMREAQE